MEVYREPPEPAEATDLPPKRHFRRLARPRKRLYTFARRKPSVTTVRIRHGATADLKR
jgi:hypothetical protein